MKNKLIIKDIPKSKMSKQSSNPYDDTEMMIQMKSCLKDFQKLVQLESSISESIISFEYQKNVIIIKSIVVYIKWIDSVKKTYPSFDGDHAITNEKNTTLTKILW